MRVSDLAYPAPRPRRPIWPWILGGSILLTLVIVAGAIVAVTAFLSAGAGAKRTVLDYDRAYETLDCPLVVSAVTTHFQESYLGDPFDCADWKDAAAQFTVDGVYEYSVVIISAREFGDTAEVRSIETDSTFDEAAVYHLTYSLVRESGHWLIDDVTDDDAN